MGQAESLICCTSSDKSELNSRAARQALNAKVGDARATLPHGRSTDRILNVSIHLIVWSPLSLLLKWDALESLARSICRIRLGYW